MTHVLHVTEDHSRNNTGITNVVDGLLRQLTPQVQQSVVFTGDNPIPAPDQVVLHRLPVSRLTKAWRFSPGQDSTLFRLISDADIIHLHGIWMWIQWAAARQAQHSAKPFILTCHGMLSPWHWNQSWHKRLKQEIYWKGVAAPAFRHVQVVQAITQIEADYLKSFFPTRRIAVIPHSLDLQGIDCILPDVESGKPVDPPYILFLGRLHPVKGLSLLIPAFARAIQEFPHSDMSLKIVGPTQSQWGKYAQEIKEMAANFGLQNRIKFLEPVYGADKWRLYRQAWAFCLPSYSEVMSMVNLEAAASKTPVITTLTTGMPDDWETHGGMLVTTEVESIANALRQAIHWSTTERAERGSAQRRLIEKTYSWDATRSQWLDLYAGLHQRETST